MTIRQLEREFARLHAKCLRLAGARADLPPGSSRARVTTANARWSRAAEARELVLRELTDMRAKEAADAR